MCLKYKKITHLYKVILKIRVINRYIINSISKFYISNSISINIFIYVFLQNSDFIILIIEIFKLHILNFVNIHQTIQSKAKIRI